MRKGTLFVLAAPSGGGKSVICDAVLKDVENLGYSISTTTRKQRECEVDGINYFFVPVGEFKKMVKRNVFLEWAEVHGNYYGTRKDIIKKNLAEGKDIILDIDVQGALAVKEIFPDSVIIFILPPSMKVLEERLRGRHTDDEKTIQIRLNNADGEIKSASKFDYYIVNSNLEESIYKIKAIIEAKKNQVIGHKFNITKDGNIEIKHKK